MLSTLIPLASFLVLAQAGYETYPTVAKTASINGFADKMYSQLPVCAQPCVKQSTSSTPCPYWDPGCLCVISTFASSVADCIAASCSGSDVVSAESLATSVCSSAGVGVPYWYIDSAASSSLAVAAAKTNVAAVTTTSAQTVASTTSSSPTAPATVAATSAQTSNTQATSAAVTKPATSTTSLSSKSFTTTNLVTSSATFVSTSQTVITSASSRQIVASSASSSIIPVVSTAYNAAAGIAPAAAIGLAAGLAWAF